MTIDLQGRVAFITGGAAGIGASIAAAFCEAGATVVLADLNLAAAEATAAALPDALAMRCDVADLAAVEAVVEAVLDRFGSIDVAVSNAGILGPMRPLETISERDFDRIMSVNLDGVWHVTRAVVPSMLAAGGGNIINVASVNGLRSAGNAAAYSAAKHAVLGLTKTAAIEYAAGGIRVNALCPGGVATPMLDVSSGSRLNEALTDVPAGRVAAPTEVAAAATWLASEDASYVTGHALVVDGGMLAG